MAELRCLMKVLCSPNGQYDVHILVNLWQYPLWCRVAFAIADFTANCRCPSVQERSQRHVGTSIHGVAAIVNEFVCLRLFVVVFSEA
mmetsp:Transcript_62439/g.167143  ORF Transcript_62439/g.167143 Transcript_62439/m.167143 type:complete len:87 (+) Transcript_62439:2877-3137(+)